MLNNRLADQVFLMACLAEDEQALDAWTVRSFWSEVAEAVKETANRYSVGRVDPRFVVELVVDCSWEIFEQHRTIPSRFFDLKVVVRRYALFYTKKYIRLGGKLKSDP